jgi:DNA primase
MSVMNITKATLDELMAKTSLWKVASGVCKGFKDNDGIYKYECPICRKGGYPMKINRKGNVFHCFACGFGGDVFAFVMATEKLSFADAVKKIAEGA